MIREAADAVNFDLEDGYYLVFMVLMSLEGSMIDTDVRGLYVKDQNEMDFILEVFGRRSTNWVVTGITKVSNR